MANSSKEDNQDLMHALESLRSLIDKDDDIDSAIDTMAIPTLTPVATPAQVDTGDTIPELDADIPLLVERNEVELDIPELTEALPEPSEALSEPSDDSPLDASFDDFWKILKPKLKQAAKESFKELLEKQKSK